MYGEEGKERNERLREFSFRFVAFLLLFGERESVFIVSGSLAFKGRRKQDLHRENHVNDDVLSKYGFRSTSSKVVDIICG